MSSKDDKNTSMKATLLYFWPYIRDERRRLIHSGIAMLFVSLFGLVGPLLIRRAIDVDMKNSSLTGLFITASIYMGIQAMLLFLSYYQMVWMESMGQHILYKLKSKLFSHVSTLPLKFFNNYPGGKLISRIEGDGQRLYQFFTRAVLGVVSNLLMFFGMLAIMFYVHWKMTLIVMAILPGILIFTVYLTKKIIPMFRKRREMIAEILKIFGEFFQGMSVIQAFNRQRHTINEVKKLNQGYYNWEKKSELWFVLYHNSITWMESIALALVLWVGANQYLNGFVTIGTLVLFIQYIRQFFEPIFRLSHQVTLFQEATASASRIVDLFEMQSEPKGTLPIVELPNIEQNIVFDNVSFKYNDDGPWILKNK
jgi:ABC-type multidrug transport system fused ATPase/permease subunit